MDIQYLRRMGLVYCPLACLSIVSSLLLTKDIDFRVYWHASVAFENHSRPLYGPYSGVGYPMNFRYPPLTYILLWPLGKIPMRWASFVWMLGAWAVATATAQLAKNAWCLRFQPIAVVLAFACMLAYFVLAIRSGNVQPYLIAMIFAAIIVSNRHPIPAAVLLAFSISFKIWPAFFLPCFFRRGRREVLVWLIPALLILWLIPLAVWTPSQYSDLIAQWFGGERMIAASNSELWYFPGQSLRGVLLRYTTSAAPWLSGFPDVHIISLSPAMAVRIWRVIGSTAYLAAIVAMTVSSAPTQWMWDGLFFAFFSILEPLCAKSSMISLGPAVLVAGALYSGSGCYPNHALSWLARRVFITACVISFSSAVLQYKPLIRLMLAIGADFYVSLLLVAALVLWITNAASSVQDPSSSWAAAPQGPARMPRARHSLWRAELVQAGDGDLPEEFEVF